MPAKTDGGKPSEADADVSTRLATLLKKEGVLKSQLARVGAELTKVKQEIKVLWSKRTAK